MSAFYLRKLKTYFVATDTDKDGVLTENDYHEMARRFIEIVKLDDAQGKKLHALAAKVWNDFFKGWATDGKSLTQDQLIASFLKRRSDPKFLESLKELMTVEFHVVDINKDGSIQLDEFTIMFRFHGIDAAHAKASFEAIDSNSDGVISLDEFLTAVVDFFTGEDEKSSSRLFWGPLV
uniref:Sarcoplasmic calcium binding protein isoform 2 n=2 Tax=Lumbricus terrestris TaxID=6398 RepID=A0A1B1HY04_LUMTE|nr:sarcoplasmic calcium binding protein isoform 2 [Lumbricus terrestris]